MAVTIFMRMRIIEGRGGRAVMRPLVSRFVFLLKRYRFSISDVRSSGLQVVPTLDCRTCLLFPTLHAMGDWP